MGLRRNFFNEVDNSAGTMVMDDEAVGKMSLGKKGFQEATGLFSAVQWGKVLGR